MAQKKLTKEMLTTAQQKVAEANIETINFWIANPVQATEDLFSIRLLDYQAWMFQQAWVAEEVCFVLCRNGGKTILSAIYVALRQMLIPNSEYWILGKNGKQSKKLFSYIERLATDNIPSFKDLSDIYLSEVEKPNSVGNGFSHDPSGHKVKTCNGAVVKTLNDNIDGNRGERGSVLFDECSYIKEDAILAVEPYATQNTDFQTSVDETFDHRILKKAMPLQKLYFSSAGEESSYFFSKYKEISKRMIAGDSRYFVADITVEVPLEPTVKGKKTAPLLKKSVVEQALQVNLTKGMREYYNKWDKDGSEAQIIKGSTIQNNSTFVLPEVAPEENAKYVITYDPASLHDNASILIGKVIHDEKRGWYGKVVNLVTLKDLRAKDSNRQMSQIEQIAELREIFVRYNGNGLEYENIIEVVIDSGAGGAGHLYGQHMLYDFKDKSGTPHRGIIDNEYFEYEKNNYPNSYPILRMIEPSKWKPIMVPRLIELMNLGLIEFPVEYNNSGSVDIDTEVIMDNGDVDIQTIRKRLSKEEELALINIDICKEETKMIHKYETSSGKIVYKTRIDYAKKIHDDRFYTLLLFANTIHELRHDEDEKRHKRKKKKDKTILGLFN